VTDHPTRRRVLVLLGASATAGLAGCPGDVLDSVGGDGGESGGDGENGEDGDGGGGGTDGSDGGASDGTGTGTVATTVDGEGGNDAVQIPTSTPTAGSSDTDTSAGTVGGSGGNDWTDLPPLDVPDDPVDGDADVCEPLLNEGYTRYDGSGSPFVATFEHPGGEVGSVVATATTGEDHSLTVRLQVDGEPFDTFPTMDLAGRTELTPAERGDLDGLEAVGTIDYAGETLPVVRAEAGSNGDDGATLYTDYPYFVVGIPHEGSEGKRYHRYDFRATVQFSDVLETGVCRATWEGVAKRMVASLEPNHNTTIGSEEPR